MVTRYLVLLEKVIGLASGLNNYPHRYQSLIPWNLQMLPYMKKGLADIRCGIMRWGHAFELSRQVLNAIPRTSTREGQI